MPKSLTTNTHALRHGDPAAGWVVVMSWDELSGETDERVRRTAVDNKLFSDQQTAADFAAAVDDTIDVEIKALRADKPADVLAVRPKQLVRFRADGDVFTGMVVCVRPEQSFGGELGVSVMVPPPVEQSNFLHLIRPNQIVELLD